MTASTHQALTTVLNQTRVIHRHSSNPDSEQLIESDDGDQLRVTSQHSDRESAVLFFVVILMLFMSLKVWMDFERMLLLIRLLFDSFFSLNNPLRTIMYSSPKIYGKVLKLFKNIAFYN